MKSPSLLVSLLLLLVVCPLSVQSFSPRLLVQSWSWRSLSSRTTTTSTTSTSTSAYSSASSSQDDGAPNLYEILGASPKDSDAVLKRKWQNLCKKLHPDANVMARQTAQNSNLNARDMNQALDSGTGGMSSNTQPVQQFEYKYELSDVNAAWGVLSDPKERRKYDRALQAQELADTFEILLDAGIKSAIPFLRKTADTTMAAAKTGAEIYSDVSKQSTKAMKDASQRMATASAIYDLETEKRELDRKSLNAKMRINKLVNQMENQANRQTPALYNNELAFSASDANKLLSKFQQEIASGNSNTFAPRGTQPISTEAREIEVLQELEASLKATQKEYRDAERQVQLAQRQVADAVRAEQLAQEKLAQAQEDLEQAQAYNYQSQQEQYEAIQYEKNAAVQEEEQAWQLQQQTERVRIALRQTEEQSKQATRLKIDAQIRDLQQSMASWEQQANDLQQQSQQLKLEQKRQQQEQQQQ